MADQILTTRKGPVLEITLNRPEIGNAASDAMAVELTKLLLGAGESSEIVVLRGAGEDFCVGRETMGKRPPGPPPEAFELRRRNDVVFNCYGAFRRCEVPVIGVLKGRAFFGCAIAAVCDITRRRHRQVQVPEMAHNISPHGDVGAGRPGAAQGHDLSGVVDRGVSPLRARGRHRQRGVSGGGLDAAVDALIAQIMQAPRPARVGCKDLCPRSARHGRARAIDMPAASLVINSSSEMVPKAQTSKE